MSPRKRNRRKQLKVKAIGQRERRLSRELTTRYQYTQSLMNYSLSDTSFTAGSDCGGTVHISFYGLTP